MKRSLSEDATTPDAANQGHGNALLAGLHLGDGPERWQVLRVGPDGSNHVRGFEDRGSAAHQLEA